MKRNLIFIVSFFCSYFTFGQSYKFKTIDSTYVFDKAIYHRESVESDRLPDSQAFVHTAFFIVWCVEKDLINDKFKQQFNNQIVKVKSKQVSPTKLFQDMGGIFIGGILTLEGYNFAMKYFHLSNGQYLKDYEKLNFVTRKNKSIYAVEDTWLNYEIVRKLLDKKYSKWK
jgi:hypothetical protein